MPKYEKIGPVEMAICGMAVDEALGRLGYSPPTLVVHKVNVGLARRLAKHLVINYRVDKTLKYQTEWYLEWRGKRVGSEGC